MTKTVFSFLVLLFLITAQLSAQQEVKHHGALKNIMHGNDLSAKANLGELKEQDHLYALGAKEHLKGEILVLDGKPHISFESDGNVQIDHTFDHTAALLVYAQVDSWHPYELPKDILTYTELENAVAQLARQHGLDDASPFPFLISGEVNSLQWHVINWKEGDTEHNHEKHQSAGPHGSINNQEVKILGFYSNHHHAVFTHHSTNMHMHFKTSNDQLAGHVDDLVLGEGIVLHLPVW